MFSPLPVTVYLFAAGSYAADPGCKTVPTSAWASNTPSFSSAARAATGITTAIATAGRTRDMVRLGRGRGGFSLRRGGQVVEEFGRQEHRPAAVVGPLPHRRPRRPGRRPVGAAGGPPPPPPGGPGPFPQSGRA